MFIEALFTNHLKTWIDLWNKELISVESINQIDTVTSAYVYTRFRFNSEVKNSYLLHLKGLTGKASQNMKLLNHIGSFSLFKIRRIKVNRFPSYLCFPPTVFFFFVLLASRT